ncbi:MAG: diguanylate cyclase, partial [Sphaerochaetaceae bacterium]|nr:diguanylate cyclase [Sphaerochaetaceae bacterium]
EFAERLRVTIKSDGRTQLDPRFNQVTLSMGLAMFPQQGESSDALMAQADKNLLKAKELGKDKVVISD